MFYSNIAKQVARLNLGCPFYRSFSCIILENANVWTTINDENFAIYPNYRILLDCSQSPIFSWDRWDIARLTVNVGHLDFQMYRGSGRRGL